VDARGKLGSEALYPGDTDWCGGCRRVDPDLVAPDNPLVVGYLSCSDAAHEWLRSYPAII
jgi:hypothetical protein